MSIHNNNDKINLDKILDRLNFLEKRVGHIESDLGLSSATQSQKTLTNNYQERPETTYGIPLQDDFGSLLESNIGKYGLGWLGNIVLLLGITFLYQYFQNTGFGAIATLIGFLSAAGVFIMAFFTRNSFPFLSRMFNINGQILLYYFTLRLHFFTTDPLVLNKNISVLLLILIVGIQFGYAIHQKSQLFAGLALFFAISTAVISNTTHFMLAATTSTALIGVYLFFKYNWSKVVISSIFLVYFSFLIWLINNPIAGNMTGIVSSPQFSHLYLFASAIIFSVATLIRPKDGLPESVVTSSFIINGAFFSFLILLYTLNFFKESYINLFAAIAVFCLAFSIILQTRYVRKFATASYALYSFVGLSVAVYGIYNFPLAFLLLSIQSLLVVSIALWFRSRIIVVMNLLLFIVLLVTYLSSSEAINSINFSFAIVALVTARIINWKKKRLEIQTELMRNFYLIIGTLMLLYALFRAVPNQYITLSNVEIIYRVVALLFLAIISIIVSVYYSRHIKKKAEKQV